MAMHFHLVAECLICGAQREADTPIANTLWLSSYCNACDILGLVGVVGIDAWCQECLALWREEARQNFPHWQPAE